MSSVLAVIAVVFVSLFAWGTNTTVRLFRELLGHLAGIRTTMEAAFNDDATTIRGQIRDLEDLVDRLPLRWEDIKREASRLDSRARYAVKRVTDELQERGLSDDSLQEIAGELRLLDGGSGDDEGMHAMPESVAGVPAPVEPESGPEDWQVIANARKFGTGS